MKSYMILQIQQMDKRMLTYITPNVMATLKQNFWLFSIWPTFNSGFYQIGNDCNLSQIESKGQSFGNIFFAVHTDIIWNDTRFSKYNALTNLNKQESGHSLGRVFYFRHKHPFAPCTSFTTEKLPNLKSKTWLRLLRGFLSLAFVSCVEYQNCAKLGNHCWESESCVDWSRK